MTEPSSQRLLIANRGEVAVRVAAAAAALDVETVTVYSEDDATSRHVRAGQLSIRLPAAGPRAYLDEDALLRVARDQGCTMLHPGYGFLSENASFAARCGQERLVFVGPRPETLAALGDKGRALAVAEQAGVAVLEGTRGPTTLDQARSFLTELGAGARCVIKALAGGGGRGMRVLHATGDVEAAFSRCQSEAKAAFGSPDVYVERYVEAARHVEVQVVGDKHGEVGHLWERDCSLQRRHQKVLEVAPAPHLPTRLRRALLDDAVTLARATHLEGLATFEFLVGQATLDSEPRYWFIEANPRLQVEHTVTESVLGIDLVEAQLRLALGAPLSAVGLDAASVPAPRGYALQARVNAETLSSDGQVRPASGTLSEFEVPTGAGVRVDTSGYRGYAPNPRFDSLLAKVIIHSPTPDFADCVRRARHTLARFRVEGLGTNLELLRAILRRPEVSAWSVHTTFIEEHAPSLVESAAELRPASAAGAERPSARSNDPLAVLNYGKSNEGSIRAAADEPEASDGTETLRAPVHGSVIALEVAAGDLVRAGQTLVILEAMKMEHVVNAPGNGVVTELCVACGDTVRETQALLRLRTEEPDTDRIGADEAVDLDAVRPDLAVALERHAYGLDAKRPEAAEKRHRMGRRTVRENVAALVDADTFVEYGPLVVAAQRGRRSEEELREKTPGDGMVAGVGRVNGELFEADRCQCVVVAYDYTVLAGTQGHMNHMKKDRMFTVAREARLPVVLFAEGGGGRPGDTDYPTVAGLDSMAWTLFGKLSGLVPLIGITTGYCFAGNAVLLGQCDVVIATLDSNIGLGGPAMVEGGGLGVYRPEEIGPIEVQRLNGVVDIVVRDEAEAVEVAKRYLAYFQGDVSNFECADPRVLRSLVPDNRLRVYDVHGVIDALCDTGSVLELRADFARGMVTALARIEGKTLGVLANNPMHLAGAIDSSAADKAARFMQLCDAFDLPLLLLCDTPGIMVGPEAEKTATARHATRLFNIAANLTIPFFTIVLRKAYGLGAMAMAGGSFKAPLFTVAWPTAEFGGMGLEGAVKLGARKALEAIEDPAERKKMFESLVAMMYDKGRGVNAATLFEFDDVIDPADSRTWIASVLRATSRPERRKEKKRPFVDTW